MHLPWYIICLIIYIASAISNWSWFVIAYGKRGKHYNKTMTSDDKTAALAIIFVPALNLGMSMIGWFESPYKKVPQNERNAYKRTFTDILLRINRK